MIDESFCHAIAHLLHAIMDDSLFKQNEQS